MLIMLFTCRAAELLRSCLIYVEDQAGQHTLKLLPGLCQVGLNYCASSFVLCIMLQPDNIMCSVLYITLCALHHILRCTSRPVPCKLCYVAIL